MIRVRRSLLLRRGGLAQGDFLSLRRWNIADGLEKTPMVLNLYLSSLNGVRTLGVFLGMDGGSWFSLGVPSGLCVRRDGSLVRPVCGLAGPLPTRSVGPLVSTSRRAGRELGARFVPGQTANVLLKQHDPCIPPRRTACGQNPESPAKPHTGLTRKQVALFKAQTPLALPTKLVPLIPFL